MNPALYTMLEAVYRRRRTTYVVIGAVCLVLFVAVLGWTVVGYVEDPPCARGRYRAVCVDHYYSEVNARGAVLGAVPLVVLVLTIWGTIPLRDLSRAPLIDVFTRRREEVAWIYPKRTSVRRYGVEVNQIHEVVVCLTTGKRVLLNMPEADVKEAVRLMAGDAPRAMAGYAPELEAQWKRDPASLLKSPAAAAATGRAPAPPARLVVGPEYPFAELDARVRYLGLAADGGTAPQPIPGEPAAAAWSGKGMRIGYTFDPRVYLRVLEVHGGDVAALRGELTGVMGVPLVDRQRIVSMLAAPDPRMALLGVLAAEATGTAEERAHFREAVGRLQGHPDPAVAGEAQRVARAWG